MITKMIVAYDLNRCIGRKGKLPWHIPSDLEWFKKMTTGHPIIMGRKTWDSLRVRPLPNRFNVVLSQQQGSIQRITQNFSDVTVFTDLHNALNYCAGRQGMSEAWIIGGAALYKHALQMALVDEVYVNEIQSVYEGDTYFPALPLSDKYTWEVANLGITTDNTRMMKYTKALNPPAL